MTNVKVTMLGTGSPRPDLERSGPSQVLTVDDTNILIDCGEGTTTQLMKAGIPPENIHYLFMTHLHSDHVFGYGQFLLGGWGLGRRKLTIVGPKGMKHFHETIINLFDEDISYRTSLGRPGNGVLDVNIIEIDEPGEVDCGLPWKISAAEMVHNVLTYGYRFETGEKTVVISGDTAPAPAIVELSKDADLLVIDACLAPTAVYRNTKSPELQKIWDNLQKEHCTPEQTGEIGKEAGVKTLVLTHFLPNIIEEETKQQAAEVFDGEIIVGKDLQVIPVTSTVSVS
ncbi:MBL fold metallo-hydrolase [Bacillus aerolatus]|uniref:MBL fold metallo-hydrolase n=1 Tax=Bacillus aerolatus TaxID=2653354 RepID=A0A6I1FIC3_9BACI|nr:MBL fold metallo-hydrolase [Bacillus aerolatus]KAB7705514.1 MBL fold metallo-hydrolase [Bacillus aerolatus]